MERNLFRRVEVAFPILDPALHESIRADLELYLADSDAWLLQTDGTYVHAEAGANPPLSAQETLLQRCVS